MDYFNPQPKPVKKDKPKKVYQLAYRTKKRSKQERQYNAEVKEYLRGKMCAVFPERKATEVHHMKGRTGGLLLDKRYWLPVSRDGHQKIENNPQWALEQGFRILRTAK